MSEMVYQTNPIEFYGLDKIKEAEEYGFKIRNKNALLLSVNTHDNCPRFRFKMNRNSEYYPDKIIDVSVIFGIIDVIKQHEEHDLIITAQDVLNEMEKFDLEFHHIKNDTLINEYNTLPVTKEMHPKHDNLNWKRRQ